LGLANLAAKDWFKPFRGEAGDEELHRLVSTTKD
jgi:hypothetical protein